MDFEELLERYQALLKENDDLKAENIELKAQLGIFGRQTSCPDQIIVRTPASGVNQNSTPEEKIKLFLSLFRGRDDVYARRWQNREGKSGYFCQRHGIGAFENAVPDILDQLNTFSETELKNVRTRHDAHKSFLQRLHDIGRFPSTNE